MTRYLALITGASAGIGAALARVYAQEGWDLALTARRADRLETLAEALCKQHGTHCLVLPEDLSDPDAPNRLVAAITAQGRAIDGLVNNAGYGLGGPYVETEWADQARFLQVLVSAPAALCHLCLPAMIERGFGRILNVASLAGLVPGYGGQSLYGAAKAFVVRMSESLSAETVGTGVHVTALCPGLTESEFHDLAGTRKAVDDLPGWVKRTAQDVARQGYTACEANRPVHVTGAENKTAAALTRLLPDAVTNGLVRRQSARFRRTV
ncbi:MAG: SDR family NAD(P)-dependent oxidoreductase [Maricaulaceae bacterium]